MSRRRKLIINEPKNYCDFHIHTAHFSPDNASCSPKELIRDLYISPAKAVVISDHDNIEGFEYNYRENKKYIRDHRIKRSLRREIINGCEISSDWNNVYIHVHSMFLKPKEERLESGLHYLQENLVPLLEKINASKRRRYTDIGLKKINDAFNKGDINDKIGKSLVAREIYKLPDRLITLKELDERRTKHIPRLPDLSDRIIRQKNLALNWNQIADMMKMKWYVERSEAKKMLNRGGRFFMNTVGNCNSPSLEEVTNVLSNPRFVYGLSHISIYPEFIIKNAHEDKDFKEFGEDEFNQKLNDAIADVWRKIVELKEKKGLQYVGLYSSHSFSSPLREYVTNQLEKRLREYNNTRQDKICVTGESDLHDPDEQFEERRMGMRSGRNLVDKSLVNRDKYYVKGLFDRENEEKYTEKWKIRFKGIPYRLLDGIRNKWEIKLREKCELTDAYDGKFWMPRDS